MRYLIHEVFKIFLLKLVNMTYIAENEMMKIEGMLLDKIFYLMII